MSQHTGQDCLASESFQTNWACFHRWADQDARVFVLWCKLGSRHEIGRAKVLLLSNKDLFLEKRPAPAQGGMGTTGAGWCWAGERGNGISRRVFIFPCWVSWTVLTKELFFPLNSTRKGTHTTRSSCSDNCAELSWDMNDTAYAVLLSGLEAQLLPRQSRAQASPVPLLLPPSSIQNQYQNQVAASEEEG